VIELDGPEEHEPLDGPKVTGTVVRDRIRLLSLAGGGYRGLFTAAVLEELERRLGGRPVNEVFDVFAGTSIGGLIASGLAAGVRARTILTAIADSGKHVFPRRRALLVRRLLGPPVYDPAKLKTAIRDCLGAAADTRAESLTKGLLVTSLSGVSGEAKFFRSAWFGKAAASTDTLTDICLATSAAPTYFPPHRVGERQEPMLDGGLVANSPDLVALAQIAKAYPDSLPRIQMLSIGTAGVASAAMAGALPRVGLIWGARIATLLMSAQERLAERIAAEALRGRYVRVNHAPSPGQGDLARMDAVDHSMTPTLLTVARDAAERAMAEQHGLLRQIWA
jgi:uncharacterized protein